MGSDTPQIRTLRRALKIVGAPETLAQLLSCDTTSLKHWLSGDKPTPADVYFRALDIVSGLSPRKE